jgi:hypothetical protein
VGPGAGLDAVENRKISFPDGNRTSIPWSSSPSRNKSASSMYCDSAVSTLSLLMSCGTVGMSEELVYKICFQRRVHLLLPQFLRSSTGHKLHSSASVQTLSRFNLAMERRRKGAGGGGGLRLHCKKTTAPRVRIYELV